MIVSNNSSNRNSNYPSLRSINDFSSDEDVEAALLENLRATRLSRRRQHPSTSPRGAAKDPSSPCCISETSVAQTVEDELRRLKALKSFQVLDKDAPSSASNSNNERPGGYTRKVSDVGAPEAPAAAAKDLTSTLSTMDTLVDMATRMFHVSIAVISLTDLGREEILAARGLGDFPERTRQVPPCEFAGLCSGEALVVPDISLEDQRFATTVPVKNARFYAGVPLLTPEGERIGVMCILDAQPRSGGLSEDELQDLKHLAGLAMHALVERRTRLQLAQKLQQATRVVSATCNDLLTPLSALELALSMLYEDQDFQGKLSGHQQESVKIASNCVGVLGQLCRGMRDQHSASCKRQVHAVSGIHDLGGAPIRQVSHSDLGLTADSFRIMYGTGEASGLDNSDQSNKTRTNASAPVQVEEHKVLAPPPRSTVVVQDMVKSIHMAMDAIPKTIPISIALHASVPSHIVTDDVKVLRCALNLLQRCASIAVSGSIQLSITPQYCRCGKAMLDFHCRINPEATGSTSGVIGVEQCTRKCCSTTRGYAFGLDATESSSSLLCCHNHTTSTKSLRNCSEINLYSVAMQMDALGGDCGIDTDNGGDGPEGISFWFRVPLEEPKSLFDIPSPETSSGEHKDNKFVADPATRRVSDSTSGKSETEETHNEGDFALVMESQPRKRRALIIEDSIVIRKVIANALAKIGIEAETAVNGMEGLHQLQSSLYDVVLCDFLMPVMDGLDCVQQYRDWEKEHRPFLRQYIIGMSAHASDKDVERGINAGMDSYKPKPLTYKGLKDIVAACEKNQQKLISEKLAAMDNGMLANRPEKSAVSTVYDRAQTKMCLIASADDSACGLAKLAEAKGWKSLIVHEGEDALQALKKRNWDAVFLDEKLPLLSGRKCAAEFREWERENRVNLQMNMFILSTPTSSNDDGYSEQVPSGANGILRKPMQPNEFEKTLEQAEDPSLHIIMR